MNMGRQITLTLLFHFLYLLEGQTIPLSESLFDSKRGEGPKFESMGARQ
jgi:hypothetical protein